MFVFTVSNYYSRGSGKGYDYRNNTMVDWIGVQREPTQQ